LSLDSKLVGNFKRASYIDWYMTPTLSHQIVKKKFPPLAKVLKDILILGQNVNKRFKP
jgi:hypothetical protein